MSIVKKKLSMALDWALAKTAQLAISQPPDQVHVGSNGRVRDRRQTLAHAMRSGWGSYFSSMRRAVRRTEAENERRIASAKEKRLRRQARNLRLMERMA